MSSSLPLISVVIPVYNHEQFIAQSLESVLSQSYPNLQVIVSDDKSSDNSLSIIEEYASKDNRIEVLYHEKNLGICGNFNSLFNAVKGEFVAFFSGDDVMLADKLLKQYEVFKNNPEVAVVHHNAWLIDDNGNKEREHLDKQVPLCNPLDWALKTDWFHIKRIAPVLPTTCLARVDYYLSARYNDSFKYKHELLFTIEDYCKQPNAKWIYLKEPLLLYRTHESNFTNNQQFRKYLNEEKFKLAQFALERCPGLKARIENYVNFMLYETILFNSYDENYIEADIRMQFSSAGLGWRLLTSISRGLNSVRLYWPLSRFLHYTIYRPLYFLKYSHLIRQ